jgi:hypothetical protein
VIGRAILATGALAVVGAVATVLGGVAAPTPNELPRIRTAPRYVFEDAPLSDFPKMPGARAVWFDGRTLEQVVTPGDTVLEIVAMAAGRFAAFPGNAALHVALATVHAPTVLLVTVTAVNGQAVTRFSANVGWVESTAVATVERVFKNVGGSRIGPGDAVEYRLFDAGEMRIGTTRVITRMPWNRLPATGGRYVVFLARCAGTPLREMDDNAIEIDDLDGARPLRDPNPWGGTAETEALFANVAAHAAKGGSFDYCGSGRDRVNTR